MIRTMTVVALFAFAGCTTAQTIYGPDGKQYTRIECNGLGLTHDACYARALEVCPQGYFLADEGTWESRPWSLAQSSGSSSAQRTAYRGSSQGTAQSQSSSFSSSSSVIYRHVVVACK
jgi:hypothetical protein